MAATTTCWAREKLHPKGKRRRNKNRNSSCSCREKEEGRIVEKKEVFLRVRGVTVSCCFLLCCSKTMVQKSMQWLLYLQQSKPSGTGDERSSSLHQGQSVCGSWNSAEEEELLSGVVASPRGEEEGQECVITVEPLPTGLRLREEAAPPPSPPGGGTTRPYCAQNNREQIGERLARHWGKWPRTPSLIPHAFATFCGMVQPIHHWQIRNPT